MANENWKTGSGLIDEFDYTITDAKFMTHPKVEDGEVPILQLIGENSVTGDPEEDIRFKVGKTYEIAEGGAVVTPVKAKANINRNSQYGKFIDAVLACDGAMALIESRDMDPLVAQSWVGLTLGMERVIRTADIKGTKVDMTEWVIHSIVETDKPAPKKRTAKKAAAPKVDDTADEGAEDEGIPAPIAAKARGIAKASDTYEQFVDSVYEGIDGILNQTWEDDLTDRAFYDAAREDADG